MKITQLCALKKSDIEKHTKKIMVNVNMKQYLFCNLIPADLLVYVSMDNNFT